MRETSGSASSRERILQQAKHLFARRGYEHTSTIMIVRAAGTSESQLVKHFGSKYGLLEALFDLGWQEIGDLFEAIVDTAPPIERLRLLVEHVIAGLNRDPDLKQLMLFESRCITGRGGTFPITPGFLKFKHQVNAVLEHMQERNELRRDLHPQAVCSALIGVCEGMLRDELMASRNDTTLGYTTDDFTKVIEGFLAAFLLPERMEGAAERAASAG